MGVNGVSNSVSCACCNGVKDAQLNTRFLTDVVHAYPQDLGWAVLVQMRKTEEVGK